MNNQYSFEHISQEIGRYRGANSELVKWFDLYLEVFRIQESTRARVGSAPGISFDEARHKLGLGHFILEGKAPHIDAKLFGDSALALAQAFSQVSECRFPVEELLSLSQMHHESLADFALGILNNRLDYLVQFVQNTDYNQETVFFFLRSLVVPFFQAEAENYQDIIRESGWLRGACPFCGSLPRYARFDKEDGRRILYCPMCRSQWRFPRLLCPFCGNSNHSELRHFYIGEDKARRVDVCDQCKRYIKATDERSLGREVIPQVEEVSTIPLDYIAVKEGYHRDS